jgi:hypothetical protein
MQVRDEPRPTAEKKEPRVIAVRPQKPRGNLDQIRRQRSRHVVALRQRFAERLLRDQNSLGGRGHNFRGHPAQGMDEQQFFEQRAIVAETGLGLQDRLVPRSEPKGAANPLLLARQIKFIDGPVRLRRKGPRLDPAPDPPQPDVRLLERILHVGGKTEIFQPPQRQKRAPRPNRIAQPGPFRARRLEQDYFVFLEEDEIAVRICAETAFFCCRAKTSERRQSSLVIVLKSGSFLEAREGAPADAGGLSGKGVLHDLSDDMRARSIPPRAKAKTFPSHAWPHLGAPWLQDTV